MNQVTLRVYAAAFPPNIDEYVDLLPQLVERDHVNIPHIVSVKLKGLPL